MSLPGILDPWREVIHPAALILPRPNPGEYAELKASIEQKGVLTPLATFVDQNNEHWLLDGVSRLQVMVELNQPILDEAGRWAVPTTPYYETNGADPYEIALSLNVSRRHLTPQQKREVIRLLREERPELSDRAIARMAGVSPHTVAAERHDTAEPASTVVSIDGGPLPEEPARREESGRRARGRRPDKKPEPEPEPEVPAATAFIGTILPTASKMARVAEARRCLKHLKLTVADLSPKRARGRAA